MSSAFGEMYNDSRWAEVQTVNCSAR